LKFFDICGISIEGYLTTHPDNRQLEYRQIPKYTLDTADLTDSGIIIGLADRYYDGVIPYLRKRGFTDYFLVSQHNKYAIAHKLAPRPCDRMWIEVNLADHCNLNCQMCDHFSHLAKPKFLDIDVFKRDMERLAELSGNHIDILKLQGGEPLLHKDVNLFVEITRKLFPKALIFFFTNGLLLMKSEHSKNGNFWQCCKENDVTLQLTTYPINLNVQAIEDKAKEYGVKIQVFGEVADRVRGEKRSTKHPFDLTGNVDVCDFISCYHLNETIALKDGRLYTCSILPYSHYFNEAFNQNLIESENDSIDIYKAKSYAELSEFVATRAPFCRYCDIGKRKTLKWARSNREIGEYIDE
jgi:sulfatase maturation enzyme AslB (radical SAM superfamily)